MTNIFLSPFVFTYISAIFGVVCMVYAGILLIKNDNQILVRYLARCIVFAGFWAFSNSFADVSINDGSILFWSGMALLTYAFFCTEFYNFTVHFLHEYDHINKWKIKLIYFVAVVLSFFGFTTFSYFDPIPLYVSPALASVGPMAVVSNVYFYLIFMLSYFLFWKNYKKLSVRKQRQVFYIIIGSLSTVLGAIVFTLVLPLLGNTKFYSTGPVFNLFLIIGISYAIFKHKLLDVRVVIQKSIIFTILLVLIIPVYLVSLYTALYFFYNIENSKIYFVISIFTTLIGILGFPPVSNFFRKITDPWFFKDYYDYSEVIHELSEILKQNLNIVLLSTEIESKLKKLLKCEMVYLWLSNGIQYKQVGIWNCEIEIKQKNKLIAMLCLGRKLSGDIYSEKDLRLLETFANQAAVALENSRLLNEVKKYSVVLEQKVKDRTLELEHARQAQREIIIDISHSLQTPLTIMKGKIELLKSKYGTKEEIKAVENISDKISKRIYDLLRLSRIEMQEEDFIMKKFNLSDMLIELVDYVSVLCEARKVFLQKEIPLGIYIMGDKRKVEEMVNNLMSNALKYLGKGRYIKLSLQKTYCIEIIVEDSGIGIPKFFLPYLFKRFSRMNTQNYFIEGMGVGLAIAKKIAEKHGGDIKVVSHEGSGTIFSVVFPNEIIC